MSLSRPAVPEDGLPATFPRRLISGGQSGADRAALDWAIAHGLPHGGFCPAGRRAEDGPIAPRYRLQEMPAADYAARTEANVRAADGTVIFSLRPGLPREDGSQLTVDLARRHGKPCLHLHGGCPNPAAMLRAFVRAHGIVTLNVAGPRASTEPGIGAFVTTVLDSGLGGQAS